MRFSSRARRALAVTAAAAVIISGTLFTASSASAAAPSFARMAALGDSITQATMTCSSLMSCPANSWSTGSTASVNSHFQRLKNSSSPGIIAYNNAVSGQGSSGLPAQAQKAVSQGANYVTVQVGAIDACTRTTGQMTPVATYKANVLTALTTLKNGGNPKVLLTSIPNIKLMYELNKSSLSARLAWGLLGLCQSMLANPTSTATADQQRRALVDQRVKDYNTALKEACTEVNAAGGNCTFDNFAVFNVAFTKNDVSTRDYFHPSLAGQAKLAGVTWTATGW